MGGPLAFAEVGRTTHDSQSGIGSMKRSPPCGELRIAQPASLFVVHSQLDRHLPVINPRSLEEHLEQVLECAGRYVIHVCVLRQ